MENATITLTLTVEQANLILNALGELPFRASAPLIEEIRNQAQPQLQAMPQSEPEAEAPEAPEAE